MNSFFRFIKVKTKRKARIACRYFYNLFEDCKHYVSNMYVWQPKVFLWMAGIVFGYQLAKPFLFSFFNEQLVDGLLSKLCFQPFSKLGIGIFGALSCICLGLFLYHQWKIGYKTRLFNFFLLAFIICLYWYYSGNYVHYPLFIATIFAPTVGISDVVAAALTFYAGVLCVNLFKYSSYQHDTSVFIQDLPIRDLAEDGFFRTPYFSHLRTELRSVGFDSDRAFAIGINSSWGYGKTSLLEILKKVFRESPKTVYIDYNPWLSASKSGLTLDFFIQLEDELSKHIETDNVILRYGRALAKIDVDKNPLKVVSAFFESDTSLKDRHDSVANLLRKTNKRFVVTIDDLDRLDNEEVFEVLRLIRNTASFSRIVFVVAYDKKYLINALNKKGVYAPERYLEKIYDVEIVLPHIEETSLEVILVNSFENGVKGFGIDQPTYDGIIGQFRNLVHGTFNPGDDKIIVITSCIWNVLRNKRDIIRFVNSLMLSYKSNYKFVYLPDLVLLELIKLQDFMVYEELSRTTDYLVIDLGLIDQSYKLYSASHTGIARQPGAVGEYDIRDGKTHLITLLINGLFASTALLDRNFEKTIKITANFPHYFIFAERTSQGGGVLTTILGTNP